MASERLFPVETASPEETRALGQRLVQQLGPGRVVALYGELGTGKTQFAKGVARALGLDEAEVRSPTFVIAREYEGHHPTSGKRWPFYHLDAYRLSGPEELEGIDYEKYFFSGGLCLIEWPERVEALLPAGTLRLRLEHLAPDRRRISRMVREE